MDDIEKITDLEGNSFNEKSFLIIIQPKKNIKNLLINIEHDIWKYDMIKLINNNKKLKNFRPLGYTFGLPKELILVNKKISKSPINFIKYSDYKNGSLWIPIDKSSNTNYNLVYSKNKKKPIDNNIGIIENKNNIFNNPKFSLLTTKGRNNNKQNKISGQNVMLVQSSNPWYSSIDDLEEHCLENIDLFNDYCTSDSSNSIVTINDFLDMSEITESTNKNNLNSEENTINTCEAIYDSSSSKNKKKNKNKNKEHFRENNDQNNIESKKDSQPDNKTERKYFNVNWLISCLIVLLLLLIIIRYYYNIN